MKREKNKKIKIKIKIKIIIHIHTIKYKQIDSLFHISSYFSKEMYISFWHISSLKQDKPCIVYLKFYFIKYLHTLFDLILSK